MAQKKLISELYQKKSVVQSFDKGRRIYRYRALAESRVLLKIIRSIPLQKVQILDIACGTGRSLIELNKSDKRIVYTGLDTSAAMLVELKKKTKILDKRISISLRKGDATKIPFKSNRFDVVFTYHLLWHLPKKDQAKVLSEMARVLKPGGLLLFDVINKDFLYSRIKRIYRKNYEQGLYKSSLFEARNLLKPELKLIDVHKYLDIPIRSYTLGFILHAPNILGKFLPMHLAHMLYLVCRKVEK